MKGRPGLLGRSALLLAMAACLPEANEQVARAERIQAALWRAVKLFDPAARPAVMQALEVDVRASSENGEVSIDAARRLCEQVEAWEILGRKPVLVRDQPTGAGTWRARVFFEGPGSYRAVVYSVADGEEVEAGMLRSAHKAGAWRSAVDSSRMMQADIEAAQLGAMLGCDVRADVARLLDGPPMTAADLATHLERAAGQQAAENSVTVGEAESGPVAVLESLSYEQFVAKYGVLDDLVRPGDVTPEQRAKMEAWITDTLAKRYAGPPHGSAWSPEDAADLAAKHTLTLADIRRAAAVLDEHGLPKNADGMYRVPRFDDPDVQAHFAALDRISEQAQREEAAEQGMRETHERADAACRETDFERASRMAFNTSADRAFERMRPMNRLRREVLYEPKLEPAPRPDWPPRYSAKPKPAKPPKGPEVRAEQRQRKAARTARKSRRGYA